MAQAQDLQARMERGNFAVVPHRRRATKQFKPQMLVMSSRHGNYKKGMRRSVAGNIDTLEQMAALVRDLDGDLGVMDFANNLVEGISSHSPRKIADYIYYFTRSFTDRSGKLWGIVYRSDPYGFEKIQDARRTIERGIGDCGDKTVLMATLLSSLGLKSRFVVISYRPPAFQHVYLEVWFDGRWNVYDPTPEEAIPGWESKGYRRATFRVFPTDTDTPEGLSGFLSALKSIAAPLVSLIPGVGQFAAPVVGGLMQGADAKKQQKAGLAAQANAEGAAVNKAASELSTKLHGLENAITSKAMPAASGLAEFGAAIDSFASGVSQLTMPDAKARGEDVLSQAKGHLANVQSKVQSAGLLTPTVTATTGGPLMLGGASGTSSGGSSAPSGAGSIFGNVPPLMLYGGAAVAGYFVIKAVTGGK